jgi:hypothetical protein
MLPSTGLVFGQRAEAPVIAKCKHCGSLKVKFAGWYQKTGPRRRIAECTDCLRHSNLPPEAVRLIEPRTCDTRDDRPRCPYCGGNHIHHHGRIHKGKSAQRAELRDGRYWNCVDCQRGFTSVDTPEFSIVDRRRHRIWREPISDQALVALAEQDAIYLAADQNAATEAQSLFDYCKTFGPMTGTQLGKVRGEIMVSRQDRECLELLVRAGLLNRQEVDKAVAFRVKVLAEFDRLAEES